MDKMTLVERFASTSEQKILYSHLLDLMLRAENRNVIMASGFLTEAEVDGAEKLLRAAGASSYLFFGGYADAERKCAIFLPDYFDVDAVLAEPSLAELVYLVASVNKFDMGAADFSHRDVLGSLMGLGIERDVVGDIVTDGVTAVMVVKASIADFIAENLTKIGRYGVTVTVHERYHVTPKRDFEEGYDTVASLRLDAVVSSIFKTSRGMAADAIGGGLVSLNGAIMTKSDMTVREGDKIAFRGKGKAVLDKTDGLSKKGRIRFTFRRYR